MQIDELIRSGTYPNCSTIMKKFEISRSTANRDIDFLRCRYNAPLEYDQQKNGFYYTDPTFFVKSVMLSEGELFTIATMMPLLDQYKNTPLENSFKTIIAKVSGFLPDQIQVDSSLISSDVQFISDPLPHIDEAVFNCVFQAIKTRRTLSFNYRSISRTEHKARTLNPYKVICQKGNWYVVGYCHEHNEFRLFSLSRIQEPQVLEAFEFDRDFEKKIHIDPSFGVWNAEQKAMKIELQFDSTINTYILERNWHENQECHQMPDGSVYLSFVTNQMKETLYWVLRFGSSVKVLNPPELEQAVKDEARKILEK